MWKIAKRGPDSIRSRMRSLAAVLGVSAAVAGLAAPAVLPTSAAAMAKSEWCQAVVVAAQTSYLRGEYAVYEMWVRQMEAAQC